MARRKLRKFSRRPTTPRTPNPYNDPEASPVEFNPSTHPRQAYVAMGELGSNFDRLAELFGIHRRQLDSWYRTYPLLREAIRAGRELWDSGQAERTLYHRAMGYEYEERCVTEVDLETPYFIKNEATGEWEGVVGPRGGAVKVKVPARRVSTWYRKHPPDVVALIFWLKNRMPERWRDVRAVDVKAVNNGSQFYQSDPVSIDWDRVAEEIGVEGLQQLRVLLGRVARAGGVARRPLLPVSAHAATDGEFGGRGEKRHRVSATADGAA